MKHCSMVDILQFPDALAEVEGWTSVGSVAQLLPEKQQKYIKESKTETVKGP